MSMKSDLPDTIGRKQNHGLRTVLNDLRLARNDYTSNFVFIGTLIVAAIELVLTPLFGHPTATFGSRKIYV